MGKLIIILTVFLLLSGCSSGKPLSDDCNFLIDASWEGYDTQCTNVISFKEDGTFSNWCHCGSPVGDADLVEQFCYQASDRTISLLDSENEIIETGTIQYADDMYLIIDLWNRCYVYENQDKSRPIPNSCALEYIGTGEMPKPYLHILDFNDNILTVTSYDYSRDESDQFEVWSLSAHKDIVFSSVDVIVNNGVASVDFTQLSPDDFQYIGEHYTTGYIEMNSEGEVISVVFYGETISEY